MLQDTIAAISTAAQDGAISIIRISGEEAIPIADALLNRSLKEKDSHTVTYGHIIDPLTKEAVDEVLVSLFRAPRTYTREDIVEISCAWRSFHHPADPAARARTGCPARTAR